MDSGRINVVWDEQEPWRQFWAGQAASQSPCLANRAAPDSRETPFGPALGGSLHLERADVDPAVDDPPEACTALIGDEASGRSVVASVDRDTSRAERDRLRRTAVVSEWAELMQPTRRSRKRRSTA